MKQIHTTPSPDVAEATSLARARAAMLEMGPDASAADRAVGLAMLGHRAWFAEQDGRRFQLVHPGGGLARDPERAFTTDSKRLAAWPGISTPHTVVFDLIVDGTARGRFVYDLELQVVAPWTVRQDMPAAAAPPPKAMATPLPRERILEVGPFCPEHSKHSVRQASEASLRCRSALNAAIAKEASLVRSIQSDAARLQRLNRELGDRLAAEIIAGNDIGDDHAETAQIQKLRTRIDATQAAQPLAVAAIEAARKQWEIAEQTRTEAVLDWAGAEQDAAVEAIRQALDHAAPALARLSAADLLKGQLLGSTIRTQRANHPGLISGARVARKLIEGLPPSLRPPCLEPAAMTAAINADAKSINPISEILS